MRSTENRWNLSQATYGLGEDWAGFMTDRRPTGQADLPTQTNFQCALVAMLSRTENHIAACESPKSTMVFVPFGSPKDAVREGVSAL